MALDEFDRGSAQLDRRGAGGESSDLAASRRQRRRRAAAAAWNARASMTGTADVKPSAEVGRSSTSQGEPGRRARLVRLLYKPAEAAEMLGIGRSKLYELLEADEIASVWIGRSRRVPVEALHAFIASRPSSGMPPKGDGSLAG